MEASSKLILKPTNPFDLQLSLRVMANFSPEPAIEINALREAVQIDGKPCILEARQIKKAPAIIEVSNSAGNTAKTRELAEWMLFTDLNLLPFYRMVKHHKVLGPIVKELYGLRPIRTASLFEMMVIAITEQQISLTAAYRIRDKVVQNFGQKIAGLPVFPTAESLSKASEMELRSCGLSQRKAEYIRGVARQVSDGSLDVDRFTMLSDDDFREALTKIRGFGPWSANYILVRGLGRVDCVPTDDLAVRSIVGKYLGDGRRMSEVQVTNAIEPFAPFRGLAVFYLLAHDRLSVNI
jgi:DNA-3-methyladenine glycosylase II